MNLKMKCACGATFEGEGRVGYTSSLELQAEKWRADHKECAVRERSSANASEVRAAVREALTKLIVQAGRLSWGPYNVLGHIEKFRDREYPALSSESPDTEQTP